MTHETPSDPMKNRVERGRARPSEGSFEAISVDAARRCHISSRVDLNVSTHSPPQRKAAELPENPDCLF
jgi:hypothetical protein